VIAAQSVSLVDSRGSARIRNATFQVRGGGSSDLAAVDGSVTIVLRALRAPAGYQRDTNAACLRRLCPDDRHRDGLVLSMSLTENYALKGAGHDTEYWITRLHWLLAKSFGSSTSAQGSRFSEVHSPE
jgi:hypothetical protein